MKSIPVAMIRFNQLQQEGPGMHSSTVVNAYSRKENDLGRHVIEYHPWIRSFWISFYDRDPRSKNATVEDSVYVPETQVSFWKPLNDEPVIPATVKAPRDKK